MKPEFSLAPLWWIGVWLVSFLVVAQLGVLIVGMLVNDWRAYVVLALLSIGCHLLVQRRDARGAAHQGAVFERLPHDPAPHHRRGEVGMD